MPDLIPATDADLPDVEAFLARHAETLMFLRANLRRHGLGDRRSPRALRLMLIRTAGALTGVVGLTNAGFALLQAPGAGPEDWRAVAGWLAGSPLTGVTGEAAQVDAALAALDLPDSAFAHRPAEPLYRLALADLDLASCVPGRIRRPRARDRDLLTRWFTDFEQATLGTPPRLAAEKGADRADMAIDEDRVRLFEQGDTPLAMTAFNAELPEIVQVGGVYTPAAYRGRRAARSAVGLHLAEARRQGVRLAVLAAASAPACRAYEALGFRRIGAYTLALLAPPEEQDG